MDESSIFSVVAGRYAYGMDGRGIETLCGITASRTWNPGNAGLLPRLAPFAINSASIHTFHLLHPHYFTTVGLFPSIFTCVVCRPLSFAMPIMRSASAFSALALLAAVASAFQVTSPNNVTGWSSSGSNTLTWSRVSTDPTSFNVVLTNTVRSPFCF